MALITEQSEFLKDVALRLIPFAYTKGFVVTGGELWRPIEMQKIYVQTGRSKTMKGNHLVRCAIDLEFFLNGVLCYDYATLEPVGTFWEGLNPKNRWGGHFHNFKDLPHFERNVQG